MRKILLILVLACQALFSREFIGNIFDFAYLASLNNKVDILVQANLSTEDYIFYSPKQNANITLEAFEKALKLQGLNLAFSGNFYYVYQSKDDNNSSFVNSVINKDSNLRYIELKNNSYNEISEVLLMQDINSTYLPTSNAISFLCDDDKFAKIKGLIDFVDSKELEQLKFKIIITETNLNNLKNIGSRLESVAKTTKFSDFNLFVNLITLPYNATNNVLNVDKSGFYSVLEFLENNSVTKIVSNPFLVARSNTEVFFSSVQNIPYLKATTSVQDTTISQSTNYEYKDVGLQVKLKPLIIKDRVHFDLHLIVEDLISNNNLTPTTSKKELKSSYTLKKGDLLVLSGINKTNTSEYESGVPLLKDIWFLGWLFKTKRFSVDETVLTLSIEIL